MHTQWDLTRLLEGIASDLRPYIDPQETGMIGIYTGGVWVAQELHRRLGLRLPLGELDISLYRDDFRQTGLHPEVRASHLPFDVEGRRLILVDDVLYTGRTIRAALNEIFDYGRPERVVLAVLADRGLREVPISADVAGLRLRSDPEDYIKLRGPEPLRLEFLSRQGQEP